MSEDYCIWLGVVAVLMWNRGVLNLLLRYLHFRLFISRFFFSGSRVYVIYHELMANSIRSKFPVASEDGIVTQNGH